MTLNILNFDSDLKKGIEMEELILKDIRHKYKGAYRVKGKEMHFDIVVPEQKITIEVKYDIRSKETGNYIIEVEFDSRPSGISTTKADYWVIVDGTLKIWIMTETLRWIINTRKLRLKEKKANGHNLKYYLIKKEVLITHPLVKSYRIK